MTKVKLKKTDIASAFIPPLNVEVDYGTLMVGQLNKPPQGGFNVKEMVKRSKIIDAIEKAQEDKVEIVELEEDQLATVKKVCVGAAWPVIHDDYVTFEGYIEKL